MNAGIFYLIASRSVHERSPQVYSLPFHDIYARQTLYSLTKNYQEVYWDEGIFGKKKKPLVLVDFQRSQEMIESFKKSYRFIDFKKAELHMDGFNFEAI